MRWVLSKERFLAPGGRTIAYGHLVSSTTEKMIDGSETYILLDASGGVLAASPSSKKRGKTAQGPAPYLPSTQEEASRLVAEWLLSEGESLHMEKRLLGEIPDSTRPGSVLGVVSFSFAPWTLPPERKMLLDKWVELEAALPAGDPHRLCATSDNFLGPDWRHYVGNPKHRMDFAKVFTIYVYLSGATVFVGAINFWMATPNDVNSIAWTIPGGWNPVDGKTWVLSEDSGDPFAFLAHKANLQRVYGNKTIEEYVVKLGPLIVYDDAYDVSRLAYPDEQEAIYTKIVASLPPTPGKKKPDPREQELYDLFALALGRLGAVHRRDLDTWHVAKHGKSGDGHPYLFYIDLVCARQLYLGAGILNKTFDLFAEMAQSYMSSSASRRVAFFRYALQADGERARDTYSRAGFRTSRALTESDANGPMERVEVMRTWPKSIRTDYLMDYEPESFFFGRCRDHRDLSSIPGQPFRLVPTTFLSMAHIEAFFEMLRADSREGVAGPIQRLVFKSRQYETPPSHANAPQNVLTTYPPMVFFSEGNRAISFDGRIRPANQRNRFFVTLGDFPVAVLFEVGWQLASFTRLDKNNVPNASYHATLVAAIDLRPGVDPRERCAVLAQAGRVFAHHWILRWPNDPPPMGFDSVVLAVEKANLLPEFMGDVTFLSEGYVTSASGLAYLYIANR
jgi:hypothetical protein